MHKADQKFSQWCKEMGFGDLDRRVRADAMWLATSGVQPLDTSETHPTRIRQWFNEQQHTALLPADLSDIQAETTEIVSLDERAGERVAKLFHRSRSGDEGSAIAKRHVEALAKKHNTTVEKLEEAATAACLLRHDSSYRNDRRRCSPWSTCVEPHQSHRSRAT